VPSSKTYAEAGVTKAGPAQLDASTTGILASPIATIVTDPHLPDNPIVAVNGAFTALTGYTADEAVGHNCRFLAGAATQPWATDMLRQAIANARPGFAELLNYRKNGSPFLNAVMIAPLFGEGGELEHFVGSQMDVTGFAPAFKRRQAAIERLGRLTSRQLEVLRLVAQGHRSREIADRLGISDKTVEVHRAQLLERLGVHSTIEALRLALEAGL
jgi:PAS domain S-box-containing protein